MGITNKNGALYLATGIDNTGLYKGRQEAIGIIKAMTQEITSFDVFGGIGISAGIAFAKAAADSYKFEKQFQQSMKEVATLSSGIKGSLADWMNQVSELTTRIPIGANEAAKALYQIVSAGHDGADGMRILEESAKAAVGGVTDTATAADAITTVLNAYKQGASEAGKVSDYLFTTVKLGKTDFTQLGQSVAQVAPIAASYGVEMDQVLAAVASLTKQGTPTAQAMTQIRAAIIGTSKVLGDGAYEGRTFQDALNKVADMAGGSESKLRELMPEIEGVNGLLGLTGRNAKTAAQDLESIGNSTGAASDAYKEMLSSAENQIKIFSNNITNALRPLGSAILKQISEIAQSFNEAFESGKVEESVKMLGETITVVTSAFIAYKGAIAASTIVASLHKAVIEIVRYEVTLYKAAVAAGTIAENANTLAQIKNKAVRMAMINTIKIHTAALTRNAAALAANPYTLAAAAIGALGYALYNTAKGWDESADGVKKYQKESKETVKKEAEHRTWLERLIKLAGDDSLATKDRIKALDSLKAKYPPIFAKYKTEAEALEKIYEWKSKIIILDGKQNLQDRKTKIDNLNTKIEQYDKSIKSASSQGAGIGVMSMVNERNNLIKERDLLKKDYDRKKTELTNNADKQSNKSYTSSESIHNKAYWEKQKNDAQDKLDKLSEIDAMGKKGQALKKKIAGYDKKINIYSTTSKNGENEVNKSNEITAQASAIIEMQRKQSTELIRQEEDLQNKETQTKINLMANGAEKERAQRELNNKLEIQALKRQKEDYVIAYTQAQKEIFEAEEEIKAKKNKNYKKKTFNASSVNVDTSGFDNVINNTKQRQFEDSYSVLDNLKKKINWEGVFGNLSSYTKKELAEVKKQLIAFSNSPEFKNSSTPEQIKVVQDAITNLNTAMIDKSGFFGGLSDSLKEYELAVKDVEDAQKALNEALKGGDKIAQDKAQEDLNTAKNKKKQAENNVDESSNKAISNLNAVSNAMSELGQADITLTNFGNSVGTLVDALSESGSKIGSLIASILAILDQIGQQGLTSFVGNIFSSISHAAGGMWDSIGSIFGIKGMGGIFNGADYSSYNKMVEEYGQLNEIWGELIDKKQAYIEMSYGSEADKAGKEAETLQQKIIDSYYTLGKERLNSGASTGSHSIGVRQRKNMSNEGWAELDTWQKANGTSYDFGGRMEQLFNLTSDQLKDLQSNAPIFWSKLDDDVRTYLNNIIDGAEKLEDIQNKVKESLTGMTFDSVYDAFTDMLLNMDSDNKDFADNFSKYLQSAIISTKVSAKYKEQLQSWYDGFAEANKDSNITADEQAKLKEQYDAIVNAALQERNALMQTMGWNSSSTTQDSTSKAYNTISQETGEELNGRFTAFQISSEECKNQLIIQSGLSADQVRILQELYNMSYNYYEQRGEDMIDLIDILNAIKKDTGNLPDMKRSLDAIERNTSRL